MPSLRLVRSLGNISIARTSSITAIFEDFGHQIEQLRAELEAAHEALLATERLAEPDASTCSKPTPTAQQQLDETEVAARLAAAERRESDLNDSLRRQVNALRSKTDQVTRLAVANDRLKKAIQRQSEQNTRLQDAVNLRSGQVRKLQGDIARRSRPKKAAPYASYLRRVSDFAEGCARVLAARTGETPDLVIAHDNLALLAASAVAGPGSSILYDAVEVPVMAERSGALAARYASSPSGLSVINALDRSIAARVDAVITVGPGLARWIEHYLGVERVEVVRNCRRLVEPGASTLRQDAGLSEEHSVLVAIGSFPEGIDSVLSALQSLPERCHLALVGTDVEGNWAKQVSDKAGAAGVSNRVHPLGRKAPEDLVSYIAAADVSLVPLGSDRVNLRHAMPNRMFESVMARLPIVVPSGGDMADLVEATQVGFSFHLADDQSMVGAIEAALTAKASEAYMTRFEDARQQLTWSKEKAVLLGVLDRIAPDRGTAVILANKEIDSNDRISRIAETLLAAGFSVTVVANNAPADSLAIPGVAYAVPGDGDSNPRA